MQNISENTVTSVTSEVLIPGAIFGRIVRAHRLRAGIRVADFARRVGKAPSWLSALEKGYGPKKITGADVKALGEACGTSGEALMETARLELGGWPDLADPVKALEQECLECGVEPAWVQQHLKEMIRLWNDRAGTQPALERPNEPYDFTAVIGDWEWQWSSRLQRWKHEDRTLLSLGDQGWLVDGVGEPRTEDWKVLATRMSEGEL